MPLPKAAYKTKVNYSNEYYKQYHKHKKENVKTYNTNLEDKRPVSIVLSLNFFKMINSVKWASLGDGIPQLGCHHEEGLL